jgi:hypothetical protein
MQPIISYTQIGGAIPREIELATSLVFYFSPKFQPVFVHWFLDKKIYEKPLLLKEIENFSILITKGTSYPFCNKFSSNPDPDELYSVLCAINEIRNSQELLTLSTCFFDFVYEILKKDPPKITSDVASLLKTRVPSLDTRVVALICLKNITSMDELPFFLDFINKGNLNSEKLMCIYASLAETHWYIGSDFWKACAPSFIQTSVDPLQIPHSIDRMLDFLKEKRWDYELVYCINHITDHLIISEEYNNVLSNFYYDRNIVLERAPLALEIFRKAKKAKDILALLNWITSPDITKSDIEIASKFARYFTKTSTLKEFLNQIQIKSTKEKVDFFCYLDRFSLSVNEEILVAFANFKGNLLDLDSFAKEIIRDPSFWLAIDANPEAIPELHLALVRGKFEKVSPFLLSCIHSLIFKELTLTKEAFQKHQLFNYAKEKETVFLQLWLLSLDIDLDAKYDRFLANLSRDDWFEIYKDKQIAFEASLLAILAYFNRAINKEELLVIHTIGAAYREAPITVRSVGQEEIADYLAKAGFPPFSTIDRNHILINCKEPIEEVKEEIVRSFASKSVVERTCIEYPVKMHLSLFNQTVEQDILVRLGYKIGLRKPNTVVILPPHFTVELSAKTTKWEVPSPLDHFYSFGYSAVDGEAFYRGLRIISVPSPLFKMIRPHDFQDGPPGLGMLFHDLNYHIWIDANNPHAKLITDLAKAFNKKRSHHPLITQELPEDHRKICQVFARFLADREFSSYSHDLPHEVAFWKGLDFWIDQIRALAGKDIVTSWISSIAANVIETVVRESAYPHLISCHPR